MRKILDEFNHKIISNYILHENGEVRDKNNFTTLGVLNCDLWYLDELIKNGVYNYTKLQVDYDKLKEAFEELLDRYCVDDFDKSGIDLWRNRAGLTINDKI